MQFELATPSRLLVSAEVDEVVAPGSEGYFGVLPGHAPFLTTLGPGEVMYRQGGAEHRVAVAGGFAEVTGDRVIILAETAEAPEEIDRARAERARQRAEQRLAGRVPGRRRGGDRLRPGARRPRAGRRAHHGGRSPRGRRPPRGLTGARSLRLSRSAAALAGRCLSG